MLAPGPMKCFRPGSAKPGVADDTTTHEREDEDDGRGKILACAKCKHPITKDADRIEVNERHAHDVVNQHGYGFHLGCFDRAPGAAQHGEQTSHWSWFSGYRWQMEYCGGCYTHIGWMFLSNTRRFHGIILDRLIEIDSEED